MGRIIESRLVIRGEDDTGRAFDSIAKRVDGLSKSGKSAEAVDKLSKSLETVRLQMTALDKYAASRGGFDAAQKRLRDAQAAVDRHAKTMAGMSPANRAAAEAEQRRLAKSVDSASRAFDQQKASVLGDRRALVGMGIDVKEAAAHQARLRNAVNSTTSAIDRQHAAASRRAAFQDRVARVGAMTTAGIVAGHRVKEIGKSAVVSAAAFDIGTRKQREFTDISAADQASILTPQAKKIGQDTQFSNLDVVKAQTKAMQGLPSNITGRIKAEVAEGILENVKNYALVMEADLETSAEAIRAYLQTTNKDISTKEKALAEANKATNQLVKMAKLGGMSDEDVQGYLKFAAASGTAAGLSPEAMMSLAALARRGGLRGDEAGVFVRAASSKLVSPTKKGMTALNAAGINYSDFVTTGALDPSRLEGQFKQDLGIGFTPEVREKLKGILSDPTITGDKGAFTQAVTEAVSGLFTPKADGTLRASDRQKIAKTAGSFQTVSAESIDAQGLLDRIMESPMSLAQLNAFFTDKHGGKGSITQRQRDEYLAARKELKKTGDDPDFAKRKADEIMGGLGGSLERLKGSVENLTLAIGQAWESTLKPVFDGFGNVLDWLSNLPKEAVMAGSATAAVGTVWGASAIAGKLMSGFGLSGSAVALDAAAANLTAAAARLGGGAAGTTAATVAAGSGLAAGAVGAGVAAGGAAASWWSLNAFKNNPEMAKALTENSMLGAMSPDAALAAAILAPPASRGASGSWGEIKGVADVNSKVEVVVSFDNKSLRSEVKGIVQETVTMPLGVGKSSPDASAGASGEW